MDNQTNAAEPKRGGCLTAFLIFNLIANSVSAIYYLVGGSSISQALPAMPSWAIPVLTILAVVNIVFVIGVWKWKRWGVYGFATVSAIAFIINLLGIGILAALFGLIGLGILVFLLRDAWPAMD